MNNTITKKLKKQIDHAFKKDVYLLGKDADGNKLWLEAPSWDCDWYWGFGYVEEYVQNWAPSKARDIQSHTHIDIKFKKNGKIQMWKSALVLHTYTQKEAILLGDLFTRFYALKDAAAKLHDNVFNTSKIDLLPTVTPFNENHKQWISIVCDEIPEITQQIIDILTP